MLWWEQVQRCFGPISIGDNVKIGANATVLKNIPANVTVVKFNEVITSKHKNEKY